MPNKESNLTQELPAEALSHIDSVLFRELLHLVCMKLDGVRAVMKNQTESFGREVVWFAGYL